MAFPRWKTPCTFSSCWGLPGISTAPRHMPVFNLCTELVPQRAVVGAESHSSPAPSLLCPESQWASVNHRTERTLPHPSLAPGRGSLGRLLRSEEPFAPLCKMPVLSRQCKECLSLGLCVGAACLLTSSHTIRSSCCACLFCLPDVFQAACSWAGWQCAGKQWNYICCRCCRKNQKPSAIQLSHAGFKS